MAHRLGAGVETHSASCPSTNPLSIGAFIRLTAVGSSYRTICTLSTGATNANMLILQLNGSEQLLVYDQASGSELATVSTAMSAGVWYYVGLTLNGTGAGSVATYVRPVNSTTLSTGSGNRGSVHAPTQITFGESPFSEELNGDIAAIRLWSAALSSDAHKNESYSFQPVRGADLWEFWSCYNASDLNGRVNGRNLTTTGTVTTQDDNPPVRWGNTARSGPVFLPASGGGAVDITPGHIAANTTVHSPALTVALAPSHIAANTTVHSPASTVVLAPGAIASSTTVPSPTLTTAVLSGTVASSTTAPSPSVTVAVIPSAIASATVVHEPSIGNFVSVTPDTIAANTTVPSPTLAVAVLPATIAASTTVHEPAVDAGATNITPAHIAASTTVHAPGITVSLAVGAIASGMQVYAPTLGVEALPGAIAASTTVHAPTVTPNRVTPAHIAASTTVFNPAVINADDDDGPTLFIRRPGRTRRRW
jgi:hypothetical protein